MLLPDRRWLRFPLVFDCFDSDSRLCNHGVDLLLSFCPDMGILTPCLEVKVATATSSGNATRIIRINRPSVLQTP